MRKSIWENLNIILLALVIIPPAGLFLLWRSRRPIITRIALTLCFIIIFGAGSAAAIKFRLHHLVFEPEPPAWGYDISKNSRGYYNTNRILPLEQEIFNSVVRELRVIQSEYERSTDGAISSLQEIQPEVRAFEIVSADYGIHIRDVRAIYNKVSFLLASK